jgi:hypothetical protein
VILPTQFFPLVIYRDEERKTRTTVAKQGRYALEIKQAAEKGLYQAGREGRFGRG